MCILLMAVGLFAIMDFAQNDFECFITVNPLKYSYINCIKIIGIGFCGSFIRSLATIEIIILFELLFIGAKYILQFLSIIFKYFSG